MLASLIKFPLVFISGVFVPVERLPSWGRYVASLSPLTYFTDLARHSILEEGFYPMAIDVAMTIVFATIFIFAAIRVNERTLKKRLT
jgi:ABC-2 type transport system permease protein